MGNDEYKIGLFKSLFRGRNDTYAVRWEKEGIDISNLECLFIVYPFAFEGKLIQYTGRIQRSEKQPVIFDYRDSRIDHFEKMFKQRMRYYKKLQKTVANSKLPLELPMTTLKEGLFNNNQNLS